MTAATLAKRLNLSRTTVSLVLNGRADRYRLAPETVERVLNGAQQFGYRPDPVARQLRGMRSNTIAILANTSKLVDPRFIEKMEVLSAERQLRFIVGYAASDEATAREYVHDFRSRRVDAMISLSHNHHAYKGVLKELGQIGRVLYYEKPPAIIRNPWYVEVDYYEMGRLAATHLISRGCRRIALLGLDEEIFPMLRARREGFQDAIRSAGLPAARELFWPVDRDQSMRWIEPPAEDYAAAVIRELVARQKADGLFAINDWYVARLMGVLRGMGRQVPGDVALVGADNMDIATVVEPRITTIDVQIDALARATTDLLFEMIKEVPLIRERRTHASAKQAGDARSIGRGVTVKPRLVIRESA
jgi:DNA-binding LacI/PurR family transcriptional regulator